MIDGTIKKVEQGAELARTTNDAFSEMVDSSVKMGELVGEIAAASREQVQGIEQVNTTVSEIDKVIQQNAANAEESASASEEMSAQAEQMKDHVNDLSDLVGAKGLKSGNRRDADENNVKKRAAIREERCFARPPAEKLLVEKSSPKTMTPEQILPMDEGDF